MLETITIKWLSHAKAITRHNWVESHCTSLQIEPVILDIGHNILCEWEFIKDLFQLHNHGSTTSIIGFKQPNSDVFKLPIAREKN